MRMFRDGHAACAEALRESNGIAAAAVAGSDEVAAIELR